MNTRLRINNHTKLHGSIIIHSFVSYNYKLLVYIRKNERLPLLMEHTCRQASRITKTMTVLGYLHPHQQAHELTGKHSVFKNKENTGGGGACVGGHRGGQAGQQAGQQEWGQEAPLYPSWCQSATHHRLKVCRKLRLSTENVCLAESTKERPEIAVPIVANRVNISKSLRIGCTEVGSR